jgi:hypothetical protein
VAFLNPVYRTYPEWKPEPLPITKRVDDLEVTLERVHTRLKWNDDGEAPTNSHTLEFTPNSLDSTSTTICALRLSPAGNTNEIWRVASVTTSDATGNQVTDAMLFADKTAGYIEFSNALWAGEAAWKLNFELTRAAGLRTNEQFTFRNVPLGMVASTNLIGWTTNCNGVSITLLKTTRPEFPPARLWSHSSLYLSIKVTGLTNDLHLDLLSTRTDSGTEPAAQLVYESETDRSYVFAAPPPGAKFADFTFAVQRSRRVEFLVKPEHKAMRLERRP